MGDAAEMVLDGILCQVCGEYIGEAVGYPRNCESCGGEGSGPSEKELMDIEAEADEELHGLDPFDGPFDEDGGDDDDEE